MRDARHPPAVLDAVLERYLDWRQANAEANCAYGEWRQVGRGDRARAYADYCEALDAEERAADQYRASLARAAQAARS